MKYYYLDNKRAGNTSSDVLSARVCVCMCALSCYNMRLTTSVATRREQRQEERRDAENELASRLDA
eukprot:8982186-Heterocapsa_arctica.AAC.1